MSENFAKKAVNFYMEFVYTLSKMPRAGWSKYWSVPEEKAETVATHVFEVSLLAQFIARETDLNLDI